MRVVRGCEGAGVRLAAAGLILASITLSAQRAGVTDEGFTRFFATADPVAAAKIAGELAKSVDFDTAWAALKKGRAYAAGKTGVFDIRYPAGGGVEFENTVDVPAAYDPSQPWMLRVQLHGGVGRPLPNAVPPGRAAQNPAQNRIAGAPQIYVYPSGWAYAQWWDANQVDNVLRLVDALKRRYNVDESRIYLTGISDGGTGVYYFALREATLWSSLLPLNGSIGVLRNRDNGADGELYGNNFVNTPLYIVNGENDPLYPVSQVEPHVAWFKRMGVPVVFRPQAGAGHNTSWWPTEQARFEQFVREHPREPHPARLSWETERVDRFNRLRWLVITRLGPRPGDMPAEDTGFFFHDLPSGRVDVERKGNSFEAHSRGVREFSVLLSPDVVDFARPVTVTVNGKPAFQGLVKKDVATLLTWAARDNDRTMLYGAEIKIVAP
jgi:predicted esterase